jgi:S1-C subfamily serine protease
MQPTVGLPFLPMATEDAAGAAGHDRFRDDPVAFLKRMLPTTALGLAGLLFCMSIASAFTGAVLYAFYEYRLGKTEDRVDAFEASFEDRVDEAIGRIDTERDTAVGAVQSQLDDLEKFAASGETLSTILEKAAPSVWFVSTLDEAGQPSVGSAFVVFSDGEQSFLLASFNTVRAATQKPAPAITVRKGDEELPVELTSWDAANDLALLTLNRPNLPALTWAPTDPPLQIGDRVFVVSGLGASGGSISQGFVADVSANGIQHDSPVGAAFQGGPLLNSNGEVLALASRAYSPLGFAPEAVFFGVPIRTSCNEVIRCPDPNTQPG